MKRNWIKVAGIAVSIASVAFIMDTVDLTQASVQKDVITSSSTMYKSEKERVYRTIQLAKEQGYFELDEYGIAWEGSLDKNQYWEVDVYETDMDAEYEWYRFHFKAPQNYVYYEDIINWYPSLKDKYIKLKIHKNGAQVTEAYGEVNNNKIPKETPKPAEVVTKVEPFPSESKEASGGNYVPMPSGEKIVVQYNNKTYNIHKNGVVEIK